MRKFAVLQLIKLQYSREDALLHLMFLALVVESFAVLLFNQYSIYYPTYHVIFWFIFLSVIYIFVWMLSLALSKRYLRFSEFLSVISHLYIITVLSIFVAVSIVTTPFPVVDTHLLSVERHYGFDMAFFMNHASNFSLFQMVLRVAYETWILQVVLLPLVLTLLGKRREVSIYLLAAVISYFIGTLIYYFFPTVGPASVFTNANFIYSQYHLVVVFNYLHNYMPVSLPFLLISILWKGSGLICLPSFHVIYTLLVLYSCRKIKYLFIPLIFINILLIYATIALGYHYLLDVIAGFAIAIVAVLISKLLILKKCR